MRKLDPDRFAAKRLAILAAAGRCFARDGFNGAAISAICAEAGISPGHLYHYFDSKQAIVRAMVDASLAGATARFDRLIDDEDLVAALVDEIVRVKSMKHGGDEMAPLPLELLAEAARNPEIAELFAKHSSEVRGLLARLLRSAQERGQVHHLVDIDLAASVILSVLDGVETMLLRDPDVDLTKALELVKSMILGLLKQQPF